MKIVFTFWALCCCLSSTYAQGDTLLRRITISDASKIKFNAEQVLNEYRDLLNGISFSEIEQKAVEDMMTRSYAGNINKIFYNKDIIVEDDLDQSSTSNGLNKKTIERYLKDFDLFYTKADSNTVDFENYRISNVKQTQEYIYIKIYFTQKFSSINRQNNKRYPVLERTAELRAEKFGKKWSVSILRIGYYVSPKTAEEQYLNDAVLQPDEESVMSGDTSLTARETLEKVTIDRLREEFRKEQALKEIEVKKLIDEADKALGQEDLKNARLLFTKAHELMPMVETRHISRQLRRITEIQEELLLRPEKLAKDAIQKAKNAERLRKYTEAKALYEQALSHKSDIDSLSKRIASINLIIRALAAVEAKVKDGRFKEAANECASQLSELKKQEDKGVFNNQLYSDLLVWQGIAFLKQGDSKNAKARLLKAIEKDANNSDAFRQRGLLSYGSEQYTEALADFTVYLSFDSNNITALADLARCYLAVHDTLRGIKYFDEILLLNDSNNDILFEKALAWHNWTKHREAINTFTKVYAKNYKPASSLFYRGLNYEKLNDIAKASSDFKKAVQFGLSKEQLAQIVQIAERYFENGRYFYEKRQFLAALDYFNNSLLLWEQSFNVWYLKGLSHIEIEQYPEAQNALSKAIALEPNRELAWLNRGLAKFLDENYDDAIVDFDATLKLSNQVYQAAIYKGDSYNALERYSLAVESYTAALGGAWTRQSEHYPALSIVYSKRAKAYVNQKNYDAALADFRECLRFNRNNAEGYYLRGQAYFSKNEIGNAIDDFNKALELGFDKGKCLYAIAEAYRINGKFAQAISSYTEALKREEWDENRSDAYRFRAFCLLKEKRYSEAINDYEAFQNVKSGIIDDETKTEMAIAYIKENKSDYAKPLLESVLKHKPSYVEALFTMGYYHYVSGNTDEAQKYFERVAQQGTKRKSLTSTIVKPLWENTSLKQFIENIIR